MRVVNLSRRPFTNRQPVVRLAILLWIVGGLLFLANVWLYAGHFSGSSKGQGRLESLGRQVQQEEQRLQELWQELEGLNLDERNRRVRYLNSLIHSRTFPWSALFDDLEDALPIDVYLASVRPSLRLADEPRSNVTTAAPARALTAREARARARGETTTAPAVEAEPEEEEELYSGDRVSLTLQAFARTDEAMFELVDRLYQDPSFLNPDLSREAKDKTGKINFSIKVTYLTPKKGARPPEEGSVEAALASQDQAKAGVEGSSRSRARPVAVVDGGEEGDAPVVQVPVEPESEVDPGESTFADRGSRNIGRGSRNRDVRRAGPQARAGLPPEEGEAEASTEAAGRGLSRTASRPTLRGPSTVSVAPGVPIGGTLQPSTSNPQGEDSGATTPRGGATNAPGSSSGSRPESAGPGEGPNPSEPAPTKPTASSTPRLQGSLFDRWIPDFLRYTPDVPGYPELREEVRG